VLARQPPLATRPLMNHHCAGLCSEGQCSACIMVNQAVLEDWYWMPRLLQAARQRVCGVEDWYWIPRLLQAAHQRVCGLEDWYWMPCLFSASSRHMCGNIASHSSFVQALSQQMCETFRASACFLVCSAGFSVDSVTALNHDRMYPPQGRSEQTKSDNNSNPNITIGLLKRTSR
jgi:hypothetical protein